MDARAKDGHPFVYVVDSHAGLPPVPPRLRPKRRRAGAAQTLLFLLVVVALCGMAIEACFLYHLYTLEPAASASSSQLTGGEEGTSPTDWPSYDVLPSKPVAHLTGETIVTVVAITAIFSSVLCVVQFSKRWTRCSSWTTDHVMEPDRKPHLLRNGIQKRKSHHSEGGTYSTKTESNSYLGGVFLLYKDDALCVKVSNPARIKRHHSYENIFGAFMI
ncbi:putative tumor necrosis factor ligand superfamily member 14-like [Scophthalmus maximus]|uniref:Putative tumor necrosis factor ligand superfamily member 14-like n=1 Tax=Scophthalmus maximus TaxID=52904 RepID=A0A2U9CR51_SCOMX|nr:putative tumor necrosis factor ligand superfamily member 14-like [Scophthalmus maximus]